MPYGIGCITDIDTDGSVGVGDVLAVIDAWGTSNEAADIDGDGTVSVSDLLMLIDEWGTDCETIHPFVDNTVVMFDYVNELIIIETNGIPSHPTGPFDGSTGCFNPNTATPQDRTYRIPMVAIPTNNPAIEYLDQMGPVSVAVNGVPYITLTMLVELMRLLQFVLMISMVILRCKANTTTTSGHPHLMLWKQMDTVA
jgi:hypothetical protein